jgi:hypothetical protein
VATNVQKGLEETKSLMDSSEIIRNRRSKRARRRKASYLKQKKLENYLFRTWSWSALNAPQEIVERARKDRDHYDGESRHIREWDHAHPKYDWIVAEKQDDALGDLQKEINAVGLEKEEENDSRDSGEHILEPPLTEVGG